MINIPEVKSNRKRTTPLEKDKNKKLDKIVNLDLSEPKEYICATCGKSYKKLDNNFPASQSELYAGLEYHLPTCKRCLNKLYEYYCIKLGDEDEAIRRICMKYDIYYDQSLANASRKITKDRSRISTYISRANLIQYKNKTYDDTIDEEQTQTIDSLSDLKDIKENNDVVINERTTIKRWGLGFAPDEYEMLNSHLKLLKEQAGDCDFTRESLLKDLCVIKVQQNRAITDKDVDKYDKLTKLYQATLSAADLRQKVSSKDVILNNPDECWGNFTKIVETMSPAEYFKDKQIFEDYDHMHEYYRRFIDRPTNNLINGTNIMDEEFVIKGMEDDD